MYQKEVNNFTGFLATYDSGTVVKEIENFFSSKRNSKSRTNWLDVDKSKLVRLELYWKGIPTISIDKSDHPHLTPEDWFFSHTGYMDIHERDISILSRNIGFKKDGLINVFSVMEKDGLVRTSTREA